MPKLCVAETLGPCTSELGTLRQLNSQHAGILGYTSVGIQDGNRLAAEGVPVYLPAFFKTWWKGQHILTKQGKDSDQTVCFSLANELETGTTEEDVHQGALGCLGLQP